MEVVEPVCRRLAVATGRNRDFKLGRPAAGEGITVRAPGGADIGVGGVGDGNSRQFDEDRSGRRYSPGLLRVECEPVSGAGHAAKY